MHNTTFSPGHTLARHLRRAFVKACIRMPAVPGDRELWRVADEPHDIRPIVNHFHIW